MGLYTVAPFTLACIAALMAIASVGATFPVDCRIPLRLPVDRARVSSAEQQFTITTALLPCLHGNADSFPFKAPG